MPFINVEDPPALNAQYYIAYNALLKFCKDRGWLLTIPDKTTEDEILQSDLNTIRGAISAVIGDYISSRSTNPNHLPEPNPPWAAPTGNDTLFYPLTINDGKGYVLMPARYTSTGKAIWSSSPDLPATVPVLWEHFQDLAAILNSLKARRASFYCKLLVRNDIVDVETYLPGTDSLSEEHTVTRNIATDRIYDDWTVTYGGSPREITSAAAFYYYYHLTPCSDTTITWNLLSVNIPPAKRFLVRFDFNDPAGEILRNIQTAHVDQCHLQPVCFYTDTVTLSQPEAQRDNEKNDVAVLNTSCKTCLTGKCANKYNFIESIIRLFWKMMSITVAMSVAEVKKLIIEHKVSGYEFLRTLYGQYNCDTRVEESFTGSAPDENGNTADWDFSYLRRPSGALVPFFWKHIMAGEYIGTPLNGMSYHMEKTTSTLPTVHFCDGVIHILNGSGELEACRHINDPEPVAIPGPEVVREALGGNQYLFDSPPVGRLRIAVDAHGVMTQYEVLPAPEARRAAVRTVTTDTVDRIVQTQSTTDITGFAVADFFPEGEAPVLGTVTWCQVTDFYNAENALTGKYVERHYGEVTSSKGFWNKEEGVLNPEDLHVFERTQDTTNLALFLEKDTHVKYSSNGRNQSVSRSLYRKFPFGEQLVAGYRKYGTPDQLSATYEYGTDPAQGSYGKLTASVDFDGRWQKNSYDASGRLIKEIRPWQDTVSTAAESQCDVTTYDYAAIVATEVVLPQDWRPRTVIRKVQNYEVSRQYHLYFANETWDVQAGAASAAYNATGNLTTKSYRYATGDFAGRLWKVENPDGSSAVTTYALGGDGTLTTTTESGFPPNHGTRSVVVTNPQGWTLSRRSYDIASTLLIGGSDFTYDSFGRVLTETTIDGDVAAKEYNCCGPRLVTAPDGSMTEYGYDVFNRVRFTSRAGVTTYPVYDTWNNEIANTVEGTLGGELTTTREYDVDGQLVKSTDAAGYETTYTRGVRWEQSTDALGNTTRTDYYLDGQIKSVSGTAVVPKSYSYYVQYGGQIYAKESVTSYEWVQTYTDFLGRQFKTQYANGLTDTSYFDTAGRMIKQESSVGRKTLQVYDAATGKVKYQVVKRVSGDTPNFTFDTVTELQDYYEEAEGEVWHVAKSFRYVNGVAVEVSRTRSSRSGRKTYTTQNGALTGSNITTYQGEGEVTTVTANPDGSTVTAVSENGLAQTMTHSVLGATAYVYDQFNRAIGSDHEEGGLLHVRRNTVDLLGRVTETSETVGVTTRTATYTYDALGRKLTETTPGGVTTTYTYNALGQILTVTGGTYPVTYTYNAQGRMATLVTYRDANTPETTTFTYDNYGRLTGKTYADGKGEVYGYTNDNLLSSKRNAKNQSISYGYNTARELSSAMAMPGFSRSYTYDQNGNLLRMTEGSANYVYTYDNYGNVLTETVPYATTVLQRGYDTLQRPSGLTYGTDYQVGYTYDGASRLSTVTAFGHSATYTRMAGASRLTATAFANGNTPVHTASRSYDDFNRLTGINGYGYTLNDNDQRTRLTLPDTDLWDYTYDGMGQVTGGVKKDDEETPLATHAYTYDQIGNRITATQDLTVTNYTSNLLNQYTAIDAELPTYDFDGNMLTNNGWTYTWNIENRLTTAETATTKLEFAYDYMGRRTTKKLYTKVNDAWTLQWTKTFVYDGFKQIAEYTGAAVTMYTVWQPAASGDYDVPLWTKTGMAVQTYVLDGNKNIRQLKDAAGVVIANYDYDPFGNVTATGTTTPWQFSSEYRDSETGLVYYNYRYYDPRLGRWTKRDPIGEDGGVNLYNMSLNNLDSLFDQIGLLWHVRRDAQAWAFARRDSLEGDTIEFLADFLKLNLSEATKWLRDYNEFPLSETEINEQLCFKIPNTIVLYTSAPLYVDDIKAILLKENPISFVTVARATATRSAEAYAQKGYHLVEHTYASSEELFKSLWSTNGIAAFSFGGHGNTAGFLPDNETMVTPNDVGILYKLQAIGAYSCFSAHPFLIGSDIHQQDVTVKWQDLVSAKGTFIGFSGAVNFFTGPFLSIEINAGVIPGDLN